MNTTHDASSFTATGPSVERRGGSTPAMEISFKPALSKLATGIHSIALSSDNLDDGRVPQGHQAAVPLIHKTQRRDAYEGLGLGIHPPANHNVPASVTRAEKVATDDEVHHSQPVLIEARKPDEEEAAISSIGLSPAMQFLNVMNSPMSVSTSPAGSRVTSDSLLLNEPERIGPYTLGPVIASGGFSVIRKATSPTGVVAVKVISTSPSPGSPSPALLDQEISIWANLHHEYVLPLFASYRYPGSVYLVTLLCPEGSLLEVLRHHGHPGLALDDAGTMFRQIVRGLKYLHEEAKIVHGDIKLDNIMLDEMGTCRIADFGLSKPIPPPGTTPAPAKERAFEPLSRSDSVSSNPSSLPPHLRGRRPARRASSYVPESPADSASADVIAPGSLPYAAPELLVQRASRAQQGAVQYVPHPAQDIWALGCVLHALLYGRLPFVDAYEPRLVDKILSGRWSHSPSSSRSKSRSRTRHGASPGYWGTGRRSTSRGGALRRREEVRIGAGAKRVLKGCLVGKAERWTIAQIHEVAWNVGWGEHDMEETEIIVEQPLAPQDEELEDETTNEGGWETVDEDELSAALRAPARSSSSNSTGPSRRHPRLPDVPSLTLSTSTTTSSLPTLSPTRLEPRERAAGGVGGRRNLSSDSGRYENVIHERDEDGPLTPIDGEEDLLKPPPPASPAERVLLTKENGDPKRVRLDSFDLDVGNAPATMQRPD